MSDRVSETSTEPMVGVQGATGLSHPYRRLYLPVPAKFILALTLAIAWTALSVWLSQRWLADLASVSSWVFALIAIGFIAYVPGFMNAFLLGTLMFDRRPPRIRPTTYPAVSVLVAAYNEASGIRDTLTSLAHQTYPGSYEILILNDGSTDDTVAVARRAIAELDFPPNAAVRVLDYSVNAGKAAVLNRGLKEARHDLIVTIDGDSWVREDGLAQIVERLLTDPPSTQAIAGAVMVRNSRENFLTRSQEWDYFHGIAAVKRMQSMYHGTLVAQGAFSLYRREALEQVGGCPSAWVRTSSCPGPCSKRDTASATPRTPWPSPMCRRASNSSPCSANAGRAA
nr:glycosyltransferase [Brevundimonas diminuta]